jgi:uncharacterized protein (DUF983 family)
MRRGAMLRCPHCAEGKLYRAYLKVQPCPACGHDNTAYPADDGPAYLTILLVGHLLIAPLLLLPWIWEAHPALVIAVTLPALAAVSLLALPVIKGGFVGLQWGLNHKGDPTARP